MLNQIFTDQLSLGLAQSAVAALFAVIVMLIARRQGIHLERDTIISLLRGLVQIIVVGSVIVLLLQGSVWTSAVILVAMIFVAARISVRRSKDIPNIFWLAFGGILLGAGLVIVIMTALGVIETQIITLVPVGSMLIANAMNSGALAIERFSSDVKSHVGQIEAGLALGADPASIVAPYVQTAVEASLIPRIDSLRSLGIVWIPGVMAGMILSGASPIYAAAYQFVVLAMIYAAAGLTSVFTILLVRNRVFSSAQQLLLRPGTSK